MYPSIHPSLRPSVRPSIYLSIYLSTLINLQPRIICSVLAHDFGDGSPCGAGPILRGSRRDQGRSDDGGSAAFGRSSMLSKHGTSSLTSSSKASGLQASGRLSRESTKQGIETGIDIQRPQGQRQRQRRKGPDRYLCPQSGRGAGLGKYSRDLEVAYSGPCETRRCGPDKSIYLSIHLSIYLSIYTSVCLSVCLSACLSTYTYVCRFTDR